MITSLDSVTLQQISVSAASFSTQSKPFDLIPLLGPVSDPGTNFGLRIGEFKELSFR